DPRFKLEYVPVIESRPLKEDPRLPTITQAEYELYEKLQAQVRRQSDRRVRTELVSQIRSLPEPNVYVRFNDEDLSNPNDWKTKYFDVVVVINKSSTGQFARVYRKPR